MTEELKGGCKCGAVRYRGQRASASAFRCHCRDCQRLTGSGHADMMPLDRTSFVIEGPAKAFVMKGRSGKATFSGFCDVCGSQLTRRSERMSHLIYVHAGSLDDPGRYSPDRSIFADAAQPWDRDSIKAGS